MFELDRYKHFAVVCISHIALLYTLIFCSWPQIGVMLVLHIVNIWLAGTVTYHRLLSHRSWNAPRWFEIFGTLLGVFSFTGSNITRTVIHRQHHAWPDSRRDPHSPWINNFWQQYFPMMSYKGKVNFNLGRDLANDPFHAFVHKYYLLIALIGFLFVWIPFGIDWAVATVLAPGALSWMTVTLGNTLCHLGSDEKERACDNWFIVLIGFGEGWHGYHHRHPQMANFGQGKFDPGWWIIKLLEKNK